MINNENTKQALGLIKYPKYKYIKEGYDTWISVKGNLTFG